MSPARKVKLVATQALRPIHLDGKLGDPAWRQARAYPLAFSSLRSPTGDTTQEQGSLNDWRVPDKGWTAELAIPVRRLTARGASWGPGSRWRILISRYNYSRCLQRKELTMYPVLPLDDFHAREHDAQLVFEEHKSR